MQILHNKKFKYGSVSVVLTALVIAAVVIFNVIFTAIAEDNLWYIDMTAEKIYTVTEKCYSLLRQEFAELKVSRGESDKNNSSINTTTQEKNLSVLQNNDSLANQTGSETVKTLQTSIVSDYQKITEKYDALSAAKNDAEKNTLYDAMNSAVVKLNKKIDSANSTIKTLNVEINAQNAMAGLAEGDEGYRAPYASLEKISPFTRINGDLKVKIIFCDDPDVWASNSTQRYVLETAKQLEKEFSSIIEIEYIDIWKNPSAVDRYKSSSYNRIYSTDVILASGTESRVLSIKNFYVFSSSDDTTPWAYNGEKKMTAAILSVTRAESPIACLTYNHGEHVSYELYYLLEDAGYEVQLIDLLNESIPEDCRLILTCDPIQDFFGYDPADPEAITYKDSEIEKLNVFLDGSNSFILFVSPDTPVLTNLEEYMEQWGIVISRFSDEATNRSYNYRISDVSQSLTSDGYTIFGQYATKSDGLGYTLTQDLQESNFSPKIIFKNSTSLSLSPTYTLTHEEDSTDLGTSETDYGLYISNGISRRMFRVFSSTDNAAAYANGNKVAEATTKDPFCLMAVTQETRIINDTNYTSITDPSNVCVCGSSDFYSEKYLQSSVYGNSAVLSTLFSQFSREVVAVDLSFKPFASTEISSMTTAQMATWTVCLTVIPTVIIFCLGIFVIVRRKYS